MPECLILKSKCLRNEAEFVWVNTSIALFNFLCLGRFLKYFLIVIAVLALASGLFVFEYKRNLRLRVWIADRLASNEQLQVNFKIWYNQVLI